jgi:DNA invertase Pin-like site-specific DNA recombinase
MLPNNEPRIGLLAIRVSSDKQGLDGDSPEAQKEQIERFAKSRNIHVFSPKPSSQIFDQLKG